MSLPIEEVIESLKRLSKLDPKTLIAIETDLEAKEAELKADKEPAGKRAKNQHTVVLLDPEGHVRGDVTAFVFKQPEEADAGQTLDRVHQAAYAHNRLPKTKHPVRNVGDIGLIKRKVFKEQGIALLTKEPVRVLVSKGPVPTI